MVHAFFILCALVLCIGILKSEGAVRLVWFFTGIIFLQGRITLFDSPTLMGIHRFLIYTLLAAELIHPKELYLKYKSFPLRWPLLIAFIGLILVGVFDQRNSLILNIYRVSDEFVQGFLLIFLCYVNFKRNSDWKLLFKFFLISSIILCLYGFYVFVTKSNPEDSLISKAYGSASFFDQYALDDTQGRFRVNSFVSHPIYYGYLMGLLLLLSFSHFLNNKDHKRIYFVSIIIIFLNLLFANSRTPLIATVFGLAVFFLLSLNLKAKVAIVIYGTIIFMMISNVPFIQSKIDSSVDIFVSGGQKTEGSTVEMRKRQLAASIKVFKQSPVFGNGLYYIKENLGYISAEKNSSAEDFDGFESYAYNLLIEQGLVGILANIIFFGCLSVYFLKNLAVSKQFAGLGFAIVVLFLIYNIGTGPLNSWIMTMALFGILIGSINFSINFNKVLKGLIEHYVN